MKAPGKNDKSPRTETEIARRALKFLKSYYVNRDYAPGSFFFSKLNQALASGVPVDGVLRFQREDGRPFEATVDATPLGKTDEINYETHSRLLLFDSLGGAVVFTSLGMAFLYISGYLARFPGRYVMFWSLVLILMTLSFVGLYLFFRKSKRYRYIKAIERFRTYRADDQWIAYDADIYKDPARDERYQELKRQCLLWGIGLLRVDDSRVSIDLAPSRHEEFSRRRKADFFSPGVSIPKLSDDRLVTLRMYRKQLIRRFFVIGGGLVLLSFVFVLFYRIRPFDEMTPEEMAQVSAKIKETGPEPETYWVPEEDVIPFRRKVAPYLNANPTIFVQDSVRATRSRRLFVLTDHPELRARRPAQYSADMCRGIPAGPDDRYIIQLGAFRSRAHAIQRIRDLNHAGITAEMYKCGCLGSPRTQLNCVLYIHSLPDTIKAQQQLEALRVLLEKDSTVATGELWIRPVTTLSIKN